MAILPPHTFELSVILRSRWNTRETRYDRAD